MKGMKEVVQKMQLPSGIFLAPMVRGSELAFRMLARSSGNASLCYSPMLRDHDVISVATNPSKFVEKGLKIDGAGRTDSVEETAYLLLHDSHPEDTVNLVVQLCGSRPSKIAQATTAILNIYSNKHGRILPFGLDLNLGCPQECASKDGFGAFLVERNDHAAIECVSSMRCVIDNYISETNNTFTHTPLLSAKIRLLTSGIEDTISFVKRLQLAGADYVTVHCRDKNDKHNGNADWHSGGKIVDACRNFPIVLNGQVSNFNDFQRVRDQTKCHAVMAATGYLRNHRCYDPAHSGVDAISVAVEYLDFVDLYPPPSYLYIQKHLRWIFREKLQPEDDASFNPGDYSDWRVKLWSFLVRPFLRNIEQYRLFVALYVQLSGCGKECNVPESICHLVDDVTFGMVKKAGLPLR